MRTALNELVFEDLCIECRFDYTFCGFSYISTITYDVATFFFFSTRILNYIFDAPFLTVFYNSFKNRVTIYKHLHNANVLYTYI